jgi:hypothetical protein
MPEVWGHAMTFDKDHVAYAKFIDPHPILPIVNASAGALVSIMSIIAGFIAYNTFVAAVEPLREAGFYMHLGYSALAVERQFGLGPNAALSEVTELFLLVVSFLMAVIVNIYFAIEAGFRFGVASMFKAFLDRRTMGVPEDAPKNLSAPDDVISKMLRRDSYANNIGGKSMIGLFGLNVQRMSPVATKFAELRWPSLAKWLQSVVHGLKKITRYVACVVALLVFVIWIYSLTQPSANFVETIVALGRAAGLWPSVDDVVLPFACLMGITAVFRSLDYLMISMMVPKRLWPSESLSENQRVVVSTSPHLIVEEFPRRMELRRTGERPNRICLGADERRSVSVKDTVDFVATGLIEQQPLAIKSPNEPAAIFGLICGWAFVVIGLSILLLFLLPSAVRTAIDIKHFPAAVYALTPITICLYAIVGLRLYRRGCYMIHEAEIVLASHWFVAPAVAYQITGTTTRSELKVGRGGQDTIETNSIIYRSEFLYDLTTAMILSESETVSGPRKMVGMWNDNESRRFLDTSLTEMNAIISRRAAPVNIDLTDHGLRDQIEANSMIEAIRERQLQAIRIQGSGGNDETSKISSPKKD